MILKLPGLIDPHVHLRDPGQTEKEDFFTGTSAALAGGFTTVIDMPNNKTPITTLERLEEKMTSAKKKAVCNIGFYFGSLGDNLDEFEKVKGKVMGLKLYLNETTGNFLIDRETLSKIFDVWPEDEGPILNHAEGSAVAEVIINVKRTGKRAHICHISTMLDLQQIIQAKEENLPLTCGVTPHHLFLTEDNLSSLHSFARMKPPLATSHDQQFLWDHINSIDCIESDHAPHTKEEKESTNPPYGVPGLETTLPLLLTAVSDKKLTIDDIHRLCYEGPRKLLDISDDTTTYIEVDSEEEWIIKGEKQFSKCKWTPFEGWNVKGKVKKVVLKNDVVFENGEIKVKDGSGSVITKSLI